MIHIELECAGCGAILSGATVTGFACPGCGGAPVYCSGAPRTASPAQLCGLCREPTPCQCDPLTAPMPPGDMQWEPAQPDAATGDTYLHDMARACQETAAVRAAERDSLSKRNAELREMLEGSIRSEDAARAALVGAERAQAEANGYIRSYAHPRVDELRAALVEIRGLALPYVTGTTREAWRAREVCRLVDETTGTTSPVPSSRDVETERADVVGVKPCKHGTRTWALCSQCLEESGASRPARTADDERADAVAYLRSVERDWKATVGETLEFLIYALEDETAAIERGEHIGAAARRAGEGR